jgi:competence protein ComEC
MTKSRVFFVMLVAFIAGVSARSFFEIGGNIYFFLSILSISLLAVFYKDRKAALAAFVLLFFTLGAWRTDGEIRKTQELIYVGAAFQEKALVVKVAPNVFGQNLIIELENLPAGQAGEKIFLLAQTAKYPEYAYGDLLDVSCAAKAIENKDAGFDYRMYMAKDGVLYACDKPKIDRVAQGKGNIFLSGILKVRELFENNIREVIPQPEGALADGLLFGGSASLSKEIQNDFSQTGMTHIVAVSGYNVTIIAEYLIILGLALGLWRKKAIWFALVGIVLFVIMSGLPASAVRAGVMGGTLLWAMKNGRLANAENAIILAGAIMLFLNPLLLRWDVGFQLSFLATLGIVLFSPLWEKSFIKKHRALGISEAIAMSLSAQIFVLPIIAYNFHITSLVSLLANIFILPVIPLSMLLVFLVSISSFLFSGLSLVFAWLAFVPLTYELKLIHILAQFPWASVSVEKVGAGWIVGYYFLLGAGIYFLKKRASLCVIEN